MFPSTKLHKKAKTFLMNILKGLNSNVKLSPLIVSIKTQNITFFILDDSPLLNL